MFAIQIRQQRVAEAGKASWFRGVRVLVAGLCFVGLVSVPMVAQEPSDDSGWQQRCSTLDASMMAIDKGSAPAELLATTTGVAGEKFAAVARERSAAGQHYVACTLFFTAAMAERQGNNGKVSTARAHSDVILGFAEMKLGQGKSLGFAEKMVRAEEMVMALKDPAITPADLGAVLAPFGGAPPVGMPPPGGPPMQVAGGVPAGDPAAGGPAMPAGGAGVAAAPVDPGAAGVPGAPVGAAVVAVGGAPAPAANVAAAPAAARVRAGTAAGHAGTQTAAVHKPVTPGEHPQHPTTLHRTATATTATAATTAAPAPAAAK